MDPSSSCLINLRDVSFCYDTDVVGRVVLKAIDLKVHVGENVAIVGPSGSGKTTLLRLIARLERPESGEVLWAEGLRVGFVFQRDALLPWRRVAGNLYYPLEAMGARRSERELIARAAHKLVRLPDHTWNRFPDELSGGERRRLSVAANIVTRADLLLLDEPTSQLDEPNRWNIQTLIQSLTQSAIHESHDEPLKATITVTHDLDEAITLADRIYTIDNGRLGPAISVPLKRPRIPEMRSDQAFGEIRRELLQRIRRTNNGEAE